MDLNEFAKEIHENAVRHGWWPVDRTDAEVLSLVHSEWSEALESFRNGEPMKWYSCDAEDGHNECERSECGGWRFEVDDDFEEIPDTGYCDGNKQHPEGIAVELIDGCIRLLDAAVAWGMELPDDAPEHMDDVREVIERQPLPNIVMMLHQRTSELWRNKPGQRPEQTVWDIADMVCIVWIWLKQQGVDPDIIMTEKHEYNKTRPYRHGGKKI